MNYRPPNWKNAFTVENGNLSPDAETEANIYEAGADAMYEPAYQKGRRDLIGQYKRENPSAYKKYQAYWDGLSEVKE